MFQFPWYWYSVPGILKEWMDQVLLYGFAYGAGGTKLQGKTLQIVTTTGGPGESYRSGGYNRFTMSDLLRPLDATAHLCGMAVAEPFVVQGSVTSTRRRLRSTAPATGSCSPAKNSAPPPETPAANTAPASR